MDIREYALKLEEEVEFRKRTEESLRADLEAANEEIRRLQELVAYASNATHIAK